MPRATKEELEWAYALTREKFLVRVNKLSPIKMNACLEETVAKYLHPSDDYISLTGIARKFDADNPGYLIRSWLRSHNTVEFPAERERKNNQDFDEATFQKLVIDAKLRSLL